MKIGVEINFVLRLREAVGVICRKFGKNMTAGFIKVNIGRFLYNLKFIK